MGLFDKPSKRRRGFTLIELLVVVAIIGILASIIMISVGRARGKARDARRKSDVASIQTAAEMLNDDTGNYKIDGTGSGGNGSGWFNYAYAGSKSIADGFKEEGYFTTVPKDPTKPDSCGSSCPDGTSYMYYPNNPSQGKYLIEASLESINDKNPEDGWDDGGVVGLALHQSQYNMNYAIKGGL
ncbi:MAG TPA: type II secretion system protein [Patescibacteria group bacterium]|nr:type II secretion system protein [Patescibacteria group bacterium]